MADRLAIVVPCYKEQEVLPITIPALKEVLRNLIQSGKIAEDSFVLYVDDGSKDNTRSILIDEHNKDKSVQVVLLSRNEGHQKALLAGLTVATQSADMIVSIDADLQDDTDAIEKMVDAYNDSFEVVLGVRDDRKSDSAFKRGTAQGFYKLQASMGIESVYNHADFRLMSKRAVLELLKYEESNLFLRGLVPLVGLKTTQVTYARKPRPAGESKYPFKKMLSFALDGITSFSIKPLRAIFNVGLVILFICLAAAIYALVSYFTGHVTAGWTSLILSIWFIGGIQLVCVGLIGEYIGKIYVEVKRRPKYHIEQYLGDDETMANGVLPEESSKLMEDK